MSHQGRVRFRVSHELGQMSVEAATGFGSGELGGGA